MSSRSRNLAGEKYGSLTVLEKADGLQGRYYLWRCICDCGNEIIVNTKNLTSHRKTHCGCKSKELRNSHQQVKDRTGEKYGALTALRIVEKSKDGSWGWECECECGKHVIVPARQLQKNKEIDCGCGMRKKPKYRNITGRRKGQLVAQYPTEKRDKRGSVIWICHCDCGSEIEISESDFVFGRYVSCGCVRQQRRDSFIPDQWLTFVDGTCVEWLANRKSRSDNTSGFRGVSRCNGNRFRVYIGLQGKKYDLGKYASFDEAVSVRLFVEKQLHDGFLSNWEKWREKADNDREWASVNPFFFDVKKEQRMFLISSPVTALISFCY